MEQQKDPFDLTDVLIRLWSWKWPLLIAGFLAMTTAYIITKFIPPQYESFAILYPSATNSRDKLLDEFTFGYDVHAERLIQLIESTPVRDSIVNKFDLKHRYNVNTDKIGWQDRISREYFAKIKANKTRYKSVSVVVRDVSPDTSALMANEICRLVNVVNANILKSSAKEQVENIEKAYKEKYREIELKYDSLEGLKLATKGDVTSQISRQLNDRERSINRWQDSLEILRQKYKIYDLGTQVTVLNQQLAQANSNLLQEEGKLSTFEASPSSSDSLLNITRGNVKGARNRVNFFEQQIAKLAEVSQKYRRFENNLQIEKQSHSQVLVNFEGIQTGINPELPSGKLDRIKGDLEFDLLHLNEIKDKYERALTNFADPLPASFIISEARPSYQKVFPQTKAIVATAGFFAIFMTYIVLLVRGRLRNQEGA